MLAIEKNRSIIFFSSKLHILFCAGSKFFSFKNTPRKCWYLHAFSKNLIWKSFRKIQKRYPQKILLKIFYISISFREICFASQHTFRKPFNRKTKIHLKSAWPNSFYEKKNVNENLFNGIYERNWFYFPVFATIRPIFLSMDCLLNHGYYTITFWPYFRFLKTFIWVFWLNGLIYRCEIIVTFLFISDWTLK